jgi:hypothetical protein
MGTAQQIPPPRQATEKELVADFAETADLHGFKVATHTVKVDHERDETSLTVRFVKANPGQGVLALHKDGEGEGDGAD